MRQRNVFRCERLQNEKGFLKFFPLCMHGSFLFCQKYKISMSRLLFLRINPKEDKITIFRLRIKPMTSSHTLYLFGGQFCDFSPSECWQGIVDAEQRRASQFCHIEDQTSFVIVRSQLRKVLSQFSELAGSAIQLMKSPSGKIHFKQRPDIHFNVAHTKDAFVIALSMDFPVGVDIESEHREVHASKISSVLLTPRERTLMDGMKDEKAVNRLLLKTWTQKEALVKCLGLTLEEGMQIFSLIHKNDQRVVPFSNEESLHKNWYLQTGSWLPNYLISVAMQVPENTEIFLKAEVFNTSLFYCS